MRMPRFLSSLADKAMRMAHRHPRGTLITGVLCLVIAFLPYYSHTAAAGPPEVDLPFIGKIKGPPERTHFRVGLPWSPWFRYWRVLEYNGPFAFNYSEGFNWEILPGSAVPAVMGVALLYLAWRSRKARAIELTPPTPTDSAAPVPSSAP